MRLFRALGILILCLCWGLLPVSAATTLPVVSRTGMSIALPPRIPADLVWARLLVAEVTPRHNVYADDPTIVRWAGVADARYAVNRSVCSTFVARVVQQAYGYNAAAIRSWLGTARPYASSFHRAIVRGRGFQQITAIDAIRAGDILAIEYYDDDRPSTGHVAIVDQVPQPMQAVAPLVPHTVQYGVVVIDSALSGHGPDDTRAEPHGRWHTGVGRGILRLYADPEGRVAGYSWSTAADSTFYAPVVRNLLIGRLALPLRMGAS